MNNAVRHDCYKEQVAFGHLKESPFGIACRNQHGIGTGVTVILLLIAAISLMVSAAEHSPDNLIYLFLGASITSLPFARYFEGFMEDTQGIRESVMRFIRKEAVVDGATKYIAPAQEKYEPGPPEEGSLDYFLENVNGNRYKVLPDIFTPEGGFDYLVLASSGAMVAIKRSTFTLPIGLSKDGELVDSNNQQVEVPDIDQFKEDIRRLRDIVDPIPGTPPDISGIYLLPDGSFEQCVLQDLNLQMVPSSCFESVLENLGDADEINPIIWKNTDQLRSLIKG